MRGKTARRLRRTATMLTAMAPKPVSYRRLKEKWKSLPSPRRRPFLVELVEAVGRASAMMARGKAGLMIKKEGLES
jgi:hypothetical protein